ncbi:hypothetical protein PAPYR_8338 [Paratrimastix pyriformis]|uniref:Uncharacterized protein n=1 Tax=Paratrimastix pyriformis TaxID=342808 RepID=A0ABQ8UEB1_9EUKA|nr:hypothetical protein PAPYR_8338 [Paratrimastix pyriformis]
MRGKAVCRRPGFCTYVRVFDPDGVKKAPAPAPAPVTAAPATAAPATAPSAPAPSASAPSAPAPAPEYGPLLVPGPALGKGGGASDAIWHLQQELVEAKERAAEAKERAAEAKERAAEAKERAAEAKERAAAEAKERAAAEAKERAAEANAELTGRLNHLEARLDSLVDPRHAWSPVSDLSGPCGISPPPFLIPVTSYFGPRPMVSTPPPIGALRPIPLKHLPPTAVPMFVTAPTPPAPAATALVPSAPTTAPTAPATASAVAKAWTLKPKVEVPPNSSYVLAGFLLDKEKMVRKVSQVARNLRALLGAQCETLGPDDPIPLNDVAACCVVVVRGPLTRLDTGTFLLASDYYGMKNYVDAGRFKLYSVPSPKDPQTLVEAHFSSVAHCRLPPSHDPLPSG